MRIKKDTMKELLKSTLMCFGNYFIFLIVWWIICYNPFKEDTSIMSNYLVAIIAASITGIFSVICAVINKSNKQVKEALGDTKEKGSITSQIKENEMNAKSLVSDIKSNITYQLNNSFGNVRDSGSLTAQHERISKDIHKVLFSIEEDRRRSELFTGERKNLENALEIVASFSEVFKRQEEELIQSKEEIRKLKEEILLLKSELNKENLPQFKNSFKHKEVSRKSEKSNDDELEI